MSDAATRAKERGARLADASQGRRERREKKVEEMGTMTTEARLDLLRRAVAAGSQAAVARKLGYSAATISQVLSGNYGGALDAVLARVEDVYSPSSVDCPLLGHIGYPRCVSERRRPFSMANPHLVRMYRACKNCANNTDKEVGK